MKYLCQNSRTLGLLLAGLCFCAAARAQLLTVELEGIDGPLRKNTLAWLGSPPESPQARANYLHSVGQRVEQSLQALGHYRADIDLQLTRGEDPWHLLITVDPGEPVRYRDIQLEVSGDALADEQFQKLLADPGIASGDALNHAEYDNLRRRFAALGQRLGYFDASFRESRVAVEPVSAVADLRLHYDSGRRYNYGELRLGQALVKKSLLQPLLAVQRGQPYDQRQVQKTQAQLQRTGYFSTVIVRPEVAEADNGEVPLVLDLYPASRHSFDLGIGFSSDTGERLSVTWRTPRINSLGHSQETRVQYSSINPSGRTVYTIPMSHPLDDILQLGARLEDNEYGDLDSRQQEFSLRRELTREKWIYAYSLRALNESWDGDGLGSNNDYLLPGLSLSRRQHAGSMVNPQRGFSQWYRLEAAHSEFGSDLDMLRLSANFGYLQSFAERHRLVLRSELGAALLGDGDRDQLAPSLSFFAGGSQSIRGFGYQSIGNEITLEDETGEEATLVAGGERLLTGSVEYQYRFRENWRGAVFIDAGDAFDEGEFDLNLGAGFGLHYVTPVGAIRLELANPVTKHNPAWRLHIAVGAEF